MRLPRNVWSIAPGFGSIWASDGVFVYRVEPERPRVTAKIWVTGEQLAVGERAVWVLDDEDDGVTGSLRRIDPTTNRLVGRPIRLSARH